MSKRRNSVGHLVSSRFTHHGAPFSKRLTAHTSCVNALAWSGNGRWLASAGDDRRVLLWDFHPVDVLSGPVACTGPRANILCIAFTASNNYVLSGGLEQEVFRYDVSRMSASPLAERPIRRPLSQHDGIIRDITSHAYKDELFITGSDNGEVILHDTRVLQRHCGVGAFSVGAEVTSVQFHPHMEYIFVMSDEKGNCNLWDTRMTFDRQRERHAPRSLLNYMTKISRLGSPDLSSPEVSSVTFDSTGTRLAVTMLHFLPTIYTVSDEWPIAICSGSEDVPSITPQDAHEPNLSPSRRSYVNACTIKNGSFGSPGIQTECYYGAGSDDFRGYIWHIPDGLVSQRQELNFSAWTAESLGETIGFAEAVTGRRLVPVELRKPHFVLYGHKSIINTVQFHPLQPYVATSGVERHVIVHSPFEVTPACGTLTRTERSVRALPEYTSTPRSLITGEPHDSSQEAGIDDSDSGVIRLFDDILRQEGTPDVFEIRKWHEDDSASDRDRKSCSDTDSDTRTGGSEIHSSSPV